VDVLFLIIRIATFFIIEFGSVVITQIYFIELADVRWNPFQVPYIYWLQIASPEPEPRATECIFCCSYRLGRW
jgi:hypothetical protein